MSTNSLPRLIAQAKRMIAEGGDWIEEDGAVIEAWDIVHGLATLPANALVTDERTKK